MVFVQIGTCNKYRIKVDLLTTDITDLSHQTVLFIVHMLCLVFSLYPNTQDLLTDVEKLLYVDTDILFLRPIEDIWNFFNEFNSTQLAALSWESEEPTNGWYNRYARHPYYPPYGRSRPYSAASI